jgi:hypothetical protein
MMPSFQMRLIPLRTFQPVSDFRNIAALPASDHLHGAQRFVSDLDVISLVILVHEIPANISYYYFSKILLSISGGLAAGLCTDIPI